MCTHQTFFLHFYLFERKTKNKTLIYWYYQHNNSIGFVNFSNCVSISRQMSKITIKFDFSIPPFYCLVQSNFMAFSVKRSNAPLLTATEKMCCLCKREAAIKSAHETSTRIKHKIVCFIKYL